MIETLIEWINGEPMHKTLALNYHHSQRVTMFTVYLPALITAIIATTTHTCSPCCQQIATHIQNTQQALNPEQQALNPELHQELLV